MPQVSIPDWTLSFGTRSRSYLDFLQAYRFKNISCVSCFEFTIHVSQVFCIVI